nr:helix-turn-helix transcriptional regulator [Agrobacterium vitis]
MSRSPNQIDLVAGSRVRMRRQALGMSQSVLAGHLGITFQQVQKYEKGANRMGASRLKEIAAILHMSVHEFFDEQAPLGTGAPSVSSAAQDAIAVFLVSR